MTLGDHLILVVDDDADIRDTVRMLLERAGYSVLCAENGREALEQLKRVSSPCLILLDLSMPVMDGYQFRIEQLRDPLLSRIPVVVITAGLMLQKNPVPDLPVLRKPFDLKTLLGVVRVHC